MNAGDAFGLNLLGRTTVIDGREIVVYSDGQYTHAVLAGHWDDCGFDATHNREEEAENYGEWNRDTSQWVDDLTAIEAAYRINLVCVHSADGCCGRLESDTHGACQAIAEAHRGEHYESPAFLADCERVHWQGIWPVVDRDGELTGQISEGDDCYNVDDMAMIERGEAREGGWVVDADGAYAQPPSVTARLEERPVEGTGWYVYVGGQDAGGPFETEAAALENWKD
jgi:hypothetical protein